MVEGWYEDDELSLLAEVLRAAPAAPVVEVGVAHGRSAHVLAKSPRPLVLVDDLSLVDGRKTWPARDAEYRTVEEMSAQTPTIGLLHHDADHTEEVVARHLELLLPKIPVGGFVCLHDFASSTYPGVRAAWQRASRVVSAHDDSAWALFGNAGSLQVFKRVR